MMVPEEDGRVRVNEVFYSIQGEGEHAGIPMAFLRLQGCNRRCAWCDTKQAVEKEDGASWSFDMVIHALMTVGPSPSPHRVCITGGEPCMQTNVVPLVGRLVEMGWDVYVETNGDYTTIVKSLLHHDRHNRPYITISPKDDEIVNWYVHHWPEVFQRVTWKVIMRNELAVQRVAKILNNGAHCVYVQPVWHSDASAALAAELVIQRPRCRLSLQLHKYVGMR